MKVKFRKKEVFKNVLFVFIFVLLTFNKYYLKNNFSPVFHYLNMVTLGPSIRLKGCLSFIILF